MSSVAHFDTGPELRLRRHVWRLGLRYQVHRHVAGARPDLVFKKAKVAVFVDGCFWHGCPKHFKLPKSNTEFWEAKVARNMHRDRDNNEQLRRAGWRVIRFWSCDIRRDLNAVGELLEREVRA